MSKEKEWVNFYYYGTKIDSDDAKGNRIKIDGNNELLNEQIRTCYTVGPYKGSLGTFSLLRDGKRIAAVVIQLFYQTKNSQFSEGEYIYGFDQEDQTTHERSMMILDMIPNATSRGAIAYMACLEVERTQTNKDELVDYFLSELFNYLAKDIGQPIFHTLVDYDLELLKKNKAKLYAKSISQLHIADDVNFHCFGTKMKETAIGESRVIVKYL